jgi:hypothetical protein
MAQARFHLVRRGAWVNAAQAPQWESNAHFMTRRPTAKKTFMAVSTKTVDMQ